MSEPARKEMTDADLRTEVGKALESFWWIRQYLDDDSEQAKAFDEVRAYAQGEDVDA